MDNLVGVRGIKLTNLLAFKKLLEVGQKKEMKLDSGKVSTKKLRIPFRENQCTLLTCCPSF